MPLRVRHTDEEDWKGFGFMSQLCLGREIREKESSWNVDRKIKGTKKLYEEMKNRQQRQTKMQPGKNNKKCQVYSRRGCCRQVLVWVWSAPLLKGSSVGGLVFSGTWLMIAGAHPWRASGTMLFLLSLPDAVECISLLYHAYAFMKCTLNSGTMWQGPSYQGPVVLKHKPKQTICRLNFLLPHWVLDWQWRFPQTLPHRFQDPRHVPALVPCWN